MLNNTEQSEMTMKKPRKPQQQKRKQVEGEAVDTESTATATGSSNPAVPVAAVPVAAPHPPKKNRGGRPPVVTNAAQEARDALLKKLSG